MECARVRFISLVIISALFLCVEKSGAQNPNPRPRPAAQRQTEQTEGHNQTAAASNNPTAPMLSPNVIETPSLQSPTATPSPKGDDQQAFYTRLGLAINAILALGTLVLAIVGIYQAKAAQRAALEAAKQTRAAISNAKAASENASAANRQVATLEQTLAETRKAADAAKKSADVAAKGDRPVLVVEGYVPENIGSLGRTNERVTLVNFRIANCGKGPALGVEALGNIKVAHVLHTPPDFGDCKSIPLRNRVVEASKYISALVPYMPHKPAVLLSNEEVADVVEGRSRLFVYGQITYRDIHRNRYRTLFSAEFLQPRFPGPERFFPSPDEYNRHLDDGPEDS